MELNRIIFPAPAPSYSLDFLNRHKNANQTVLARSLDINPIDRLIFIKSLDISSKPSTQPHREDPII